MLISSMQRILTASGLIGATLFAAGCDTLGSPLDIVSGRRDAPDEFLVVARKPLKMPGSLSLPEPRLGEQSPLEPDARGAAVVALLGAPTVAASTTGASAGERALLDAANASAQTAPGLQEDLQQTEQRLEDAQPYEAPLLVDLLSGESEEEGVDDAIDASLEARRLQTQGVSSAPIDPNDRPSLQTDEEPRQVDPIDRRPNNRLPNAPNETAF
ncbi:MAG: DUF3035 domain-containing protein [Pseudomonadota bacterium]